MTVDFFIRRPVFSTVCSLMIVIAGVVAIRALPIAQYPNLAPPQVAITTMYTGANAQTVEAAVTTPIEKEINGVEGLKYVTSNSGNDGTSSIIATFNVDRDPDRAVVDIQNKVNAVLGRLPAPVRAGGVRVAKATSSFLFGTGIYAENGEYDTLFISNYVDRYVRDNLRRIDGVADVVIFGERKYSMRLWLDPEKMASRGLTATDVVQALGEQNAEIAAGQIGAPPSRGAQEFQISIRAAGRLSTPEEFNNVILKTASDGTQVRLHDVGRAELGAENYDSVLEFNGRNAVGVAVAQLPNANALEVYRKCVAELERLSKRFPPGLKFKVAFDSTGVISESVKDVVFTLGLAIVLVILVMFAFLQDWRSTLMPALAIPVSLVGTCVFVHLLGFSLNTLTLFGLTLATGLVVDDAIVVVENVQRHMQEGAQSAFAAVRAAMREITGAVIATSLVLVSVFVPVAFFPGTTGILYRQFALTVAFSVAISAFTALTMTPALSGKLLRGHSRAPRVFGPFNRIAERIAASYGSSLRVAMRWKWAVLVLFVGALGLTWTTSKALPGGFIPEEDQGFFITMIQAPQGASLDYTAGIANKVQKALLKEPDVVGVFSISGFSFFGNAPNRALIFSPLKSIADRTRPEQRVDAILNRVRGPLMSIPGAIIVPFAPPAVAGIGNVGGFQYVVQDLQGHTLQELEGATQNILRAGWRTPQVTGLFTSFSASDPQLLVSIDREKAKKLQVPLTQIADALQVYMGSSYVNDFTFNNNAYRVYVQADQKFRLRSSDVEQIYVRAGNGGMIPLANLLHISQSTTAQVISHHNLFRSVEIDGAPAPGISSSQAMEAMDKMGRSLPQGFASEWIGLSLEETQSTGQGLFLFSVGLLLVYLTLAAQYESFAVPFTVVLAVPVAVLGALGAQLLRGLVNDVYCQIGIVMLIGLASKNAILIAEFAEQLYGDGRSIVEAAAEAAQIRLRPILMTSLTFILGVLPLVFATGAGDAARHSLGTAVLGGMVMSTALNLFFTPVLYVFVKTIAVKIQNLRQTKPFPVPEEKYGEQAA